LALLQGTNSLANIEDKIDIIDTNVDQIETAVITNAAGADISADILVIDNFVDGIETAVITNAAGTDIAADIIAMKVDTAATLVDTAVIGALGAGLTDLGGMSTGMKAEVESEANDALVAQKLDHLVAVADGDDPVDDSIIAHLVSTTQDWSTFVPSTDSLQAVRDRGDTAWTTGAGGSDRLLMVDTTIATLSTQTSFTLTAGSADDDAYNNCTIVIEDVSTSTQKISRIDFSLYWLVKNDNPQV